MTAEVRSVKECLLVMFPLGLPEEFAGLSLSEQYDFVKKQYKSLVLIAHPDKGGSTEAFCILNSAFLSIKALVEAKEVTSLSSEEVDPPTNYGTFYADFRAGSAYYEEDSMDGQGHCSQAKQ